MSTIDLLRMDERRRRMAGFSAERGIGVVLLVATLLTGCAASDLAVSTLEPSASSSAVDPTASNPSLTREEIEDIFSETLGLSLAEARSAIPYEIVVSTTASEDAPVVVETFDCNGEPYVERIQIEDVNGDAVVAEGMVACPPGN